MEYCAVRGILDQSLSSTNQQFDIHRDVGRGLVIAALHEAYVGGDRGGTGPAYQLLELRVQKLVPFILRGLEGFERPSCKDIKSSLETAFQRVDEEVRTRAKELVFNCCPLELETKLNSFVVVVHDGFVYVAGAAGADIFLARDSKELRLTSSDHFISRTFGIEKDRPMIRLSTEPILYYFRQERLQATDAYLVMASKFIEFYLNTSMLKVLQSRIDAVGLNEACKSMVGPYRDKTKILIVITLQPGAHEPKRRIQPAVDEEPVRPVSTRIDDYRDPEDPLRFLQPYVNGKKQRPVPVTTFWYDSTYYIPERCSKKEMSSIKKEKKKSILWKPLVIQAFSEDQAPQKHHVVRFLFCF